MLLDKVSNIIQITENSELLEEYNAVRMAVRKAVTKVASPKTARVLNAPIFTNGVKDYGKEMVKDVASAGIKIAAPQAAPLLGKYEAAAKMAGEAASTVKEAKLTHNATKIVKNNQTGRKVLPLLLTATKAVLPTRTISKATNEATQNSNSERIIDQHLNNIRSLRSNDPERQKSLKHLQDMNKTVQGRNLLNHHKELHFDVQK